MSDASEDPRVRVDVPEATLCLAVKPVDAVTGGRLLGDPTVTVEGIDAEPVENRSGYHVFLGPAPPDGPLAVSVDGGERYLATGRDVLVSSGNDDDGVDDRAVDEGSDIAVVPSARPVLRIELRPSPAYPFPPHATLVRGHVRDTDREGVVGARLSVRGVDVSTRSVRDGEFVLPFRLGPAIEVEPAAPGTAGEEQGGAGNGAGAEATGTGAAGRGHARARRLLKIAGEDPTIDVTPPDDRPDLGETSVSLAVEEGKITIPERHEIIITE